MRKKCECSLKKVLTRRRHVVKNTLCENKSTVLAFLLQSKRIRIILTRLH